MSKKSMEMMKVIESGVQEVFKSEKYLDFLKFAAKFHHYSANNIVLLYQQKPDASFVAGFSTWKSMGKNMGKDVRIKKGSHALYVIAPYTRTETDESGNEIVRLLFKAAPVFDISSVDGVEIPEFCPQLQGDVENYGDLLDALVSVSPVPVSFREFDGEALGYYSPDALEIVVRPGMSQLATIKTTLHEQAHAWVYANLPEGETLDRHDHETIAESCACITAEFLGLDTSDYSFPYIASWTGEGKSTEMLRKNLDMIIKISDHMIRLIEDLQGKESEEC